MIPDDYWEAHSAIASWAACPLRDQTSDDPNDDLYDLETECLYEVYKVRALRFLKKPERLTAVTVLTQALIEDNNLTVEKATEIVEQVLGIRG
jgi:hypothetical protein